MTSPLQFELLATDAGARRGRITLPRGEIELRRFSGRTTDTKMLVDLESLTRDPETGHIWAGFEGTNAIERVDVDFASSVVVRPDAMASRKASSWPFSRR